MTTGKPLSIWLDAEETSKVKEKAKKEKRSVSNYIKWKVFNNE